MSLHLLKGSSYTPRADLTLVSTPKLLQDNTAHLQENELKGVKWLSSR